MAIPEISVLGPPKNARVENKFSAAEHVAGDIAAKRVHRNLFCCTDQACPLLLLVF
jgi:hypothetical protein